MKDIKDYLPFYLGQGLWICKNSEGKDVFSILDVNLLKEMIDEGADYKLLLRPLYSMTEEEYEELECAGGNVENTDDEWRFVKKESAQTIYLLSKGFDLFRLIESGHALDLTTIKI